MVRVESVVLPGESVSPNIIIKLPLVTHGGDAMIHCAAWSFVL